MIGQHFNLMQLNNTIYKNVQIVRPAQSQNPHQSVARQAQSLARLNRHKNNITSSRGSHCTLNRFAIVDVIMRICRVILLRGTDSAFSIFKPF